jgi:hypothetical protein
MQIRVPIQERARCGEDKTRPNLERIQTMPFVAQGEKNLPGTFTPPFPQSLDNSTAQLTITSDRVAAQLKAVLPLRNGHCCEELFTSVNAKRRDPNQAG